MRLRYSATFKKQYRKLPFPLQKQFDERVVLFVAQPTHPRLRVHPLKGKYAGYWSMNVSGDVRALYRFEVDDIIVFALIGTHSKLYG